jgi:16S rRNA (cytidine1402-2'-O)-methyltransferase
VGSGTIYVVATPIGNLEDLTRRAERTLSEVDFVAAEDTRRARTLLRHLGIEKPLVSYYDAVESRKSRALVSRCQAGESMALVSDAGTPLLSDPGFRLIQEAHEAGVKVVPIPGVSAPIALLSCAGVAPLPFVFLGFLPSRSTARRRFIAPYRDRPETLVFFETARRLPAALGDLADLLGDRPAVIGRELTKVHEEIRRGTLEDLAASYGPDGGATLRGEIVVAVAGCDEEGGAVDDEKMEAALRVLLAKGESASRAAREVAADLGVSRREVYQKALALTDPSAGGGKRSAD